jgi:hypothetical protein
MFVKTVLYKVLGGMTMSVSLLVLRLSMFCSFICVYVLVPIHIYWLETKCLLNHINIYFFCMSVDTKLFSNQMKSLVPGF